MSTSVQVTDGDFWWIAVVIALTGCLIDATGWVIEKSTHMSIESQLPLNYNRSEETTKESLQYLWSCKWWCGFITHILGTALFSSSLAFSDASLVMPLQSATLAFNTLFAWKFLNEKLNKKQIFGTILIVIGCTFAVVVGPKTKESSYTAQDLAERFKHLAFLIFTGFVLFLALMDYVLFKYVLNNYTLLLLSYVFKAGFFASWNILFIKCFIELLISSSISIDQFKENGKNWISYILFFLICFSKVTSEFWREEALKIYPGNYVGSIYTLFYIVGAISFASIYFNEFDQTEAGIVLAFTICVGVSFIGVLCLTFGGTRTMDKHLIGDESIVSPISKMSESIEIESIESKYQNSTHRKTSNMEITIFADQTETQKLMRKFYAYVK